MIEKKSGFKNYNDTFWVNEKGRFGCRYQCKFCNKVTLGLAGDDRMHFTTCLKYASGLTLRPATDQPMPTPNGNPAIVDLVLEDFRGRDRIGRERYGTRLQAHNGRDALRDAYEDALDLALYLRQCIAERDSK